MMVMHAQLFLYRFWILRSELGSCGQPGPGFNLVLSPPPDYRKSASSTLTASSQKSRPCLNTVDPESLQRELLLRISDFSVLFHTLQWFTDIYIYLVYCRILKYISFCSKDKWASKNGHCRSFYWRFSFIPQSWRYTGYLVNQIQALFASPKSWRWFSAMSELV